MSKLLINESPMQFLPGLAKALGNANCAIILQQLHYLMDSAKVSDNVYVHIDDAWWVYNSYKQWHEKYFGWISPDTIKRHFLQLEKSGIVLTRQGVKNVSDRRKWYTINYDAVDNLLTMRAECPDGTSGQNAPVVGAECPDGLSKSPSKSETPNAANPGGASEPLTYEQQCSIHAPGNLNDYTDDKCPDCGEWMIWLSIWSSLHWRWCGSCEVKHTVDNAWHGVATEHEPGTQRNAERIAKGYPPGWFERTAGCLADNPIERGEQGWVSPNAISTGRRGADDIFPMDENGYWEKSLTHPGMFQERVGETVHFPPVLTFLTHHAQNIAQLIIADRPVRFAKALDLTALEELRKAGYVKWPVIRGDGQTYTLTDTGKALADNPLVKGAVDAAKRKADMIERGKAIGLTGTRGGKGNGKSKKFTISPEYLPVFNAMCEAFETTPDMIPQDQWSNWAKVASQLTAIGYDADETLALHAHCVAQKWDKVFVVNALLSQSVPFRAAKKAAPEQNTTIIIDMSNYGESE